MKKDLLAQVLVSNGGEEEDRTPDLCIANAALSQLSYFPVELPHYNESAQSRQTGVTNSG
jgi:hypothetical protein